LGLHPQFKSKTTDKVKRTADEAKEKGTSESAVLVPGKGPGEKGGRRQRSGTSMQGLDNVLERKRRRSRKGKDEKAHIIKIRGGEGAHP